MARSLEITASFSSVKRKHTATLLSQMGIVAAVTPADSGPYRNQVPVRVTAP